MAANGLEFLNQKYKTAEQIRDEYPKIQEQYAAGRFPEEIAHHYPALKLPDVYLVVGYYLQNRAEVDSYVQRQQRQADEARHEYETAYPNDPLRERLLAQLVERRKRA